MKAKDVETAKEDRIEYEIDLPPEYCRYRDDGCELAASCLRCPFPRCMHEEKGASRKWLKQARAREMARLFAGKQKHVKDLAAMFGVSPRTVRRALRKMRERNGNEI